MQITNQPLPAYTDADLAANLDFWSDLLGGVHRLGESTLAWIIALEAETERREVTAADLAATVA